MLVLGALVVTGVVQIQLQVDLVARVVLFNISQPTIQILMEDRVVEAVMGEVMGGVGMADREEAGGLEAQVELASVLPLPFLQAVLELLVFQVLQVHQAFQGPGRSAVVVTRIIVLTRPQEARVVLGTPVPGERPVRRAQAVHLVGMAAAAALVRLVSPA